MQEHKLLTRPKVLLIGDTHPEMIAVAKNLSLKGTVFKIVLPTYFTMTESKRIARLGIGIAGLKPWLQKRTLHPSITSETIIRSFAYLETLTWIFKRLGFYNISWKFTVKYNERITQLIPRVIEIFQPDIVVSYDTIKVPKTDRFKYIVICPLSHPVAVENSLNQSKDFFPNWPEMKDEKPLGVHDTALNADRIVLLSQFAKESYVSQGFEASKLEVIYIGAINANLNSRSPLEKNNNYLRILYLGRMTRVKGVEALARLSHLLNPVEFQICLVGQCSPEIAKYVREISNSEVLKLIENPKPNEISKYYVESDIFALPSFNDGFNIATLEAMSYGLIPIISKNAGVSEVIQNTPLSNFIIDPGSIENLQKCINYLANLSRDEFNCLANLSFDLSRNFSFDRFAEDFSKMMFNESSK